MKVGIQTSRQFNLEMQVRDANHIKLLKWSRFEWSANSGF